MKITELSLPCKVKLNSNFRLDASFDENTILLLRNKRVDWVGENGNSDCYEIEVVALKEDEVHNKMVAKRIWYDKQQRPVLTIYEARSDFYDALGDFHTSIFVMADEDCFDPLPRKKIERKWRGTTNFNWKKFTEYVNSYEPSTHSCDDFCIIEDMVYGLGVALHHKYNGTDGYRKFLIDLNGQFVEKYSKKVE